MRVADLIAKLEEMDPNLPVLVYTRMGEDMDEAHDVVLQDKLKPEEFLYCKADHPLDEKYGWIEGITVAACIC